MPVFRHQGVVLDYEDLRYNPRDDIIYPSVVEAHKFFARPLGRYYLYYAPHDTPGGICLAYADALEGPWREYDANPVITRAWVGHYEVSHVSGPDAIWNPEEKKLFLYYHGENSVTRLASSADGIHFDYQGSVVTTDMFDDVSEASYGRVARYNLPGKDNRYIMLLMGNNRGTRRIYLAWSKDGRQWETRRTPLMDPPPGTDQVAGAWYLPWQGKHYLIVHANRAADPGAFNVNFNLYVAEVDAAFERTQHLGLFYSRTAVSPANEAVMSPCMVAEGNRLYMFLNIGPRLHNKIALAVAEVPPSVRAGTHDTISRQIDLSGSWQFDVDPEDVGVREKWFEGRRSFQRQIQVPGAWNAQGVEFETQEQLQRYLAQPVEEKLRGPGTEADRLFHVYPGPGWYRRIVQVPGAWRGRTIWLKFGGVHRNADVWIDGRHVGTHIGYVVPFEYDVTEFVTPGREAAITLRVDARRNRDIDPLMGCMDTLDFLYLTWGGVHRGVSLEATGDSWLDDVFVVPHVADGSVEVRVTPGHATAAVYRPLRVAVEVRDQQDQRVAGCDAPLPWESTTAVTLRVPDARPWSPERPHLYVAHVTCLDGQKRLDEKRVRFGLREFRVAGGRFLLNGQPIFLRGYGDDCIYPNTIAPPVDRGEYRKRFQVVKDFGFNFARHHSWMPVEEYLDAADEMGIMLQPEFPIAYRWDLAAKPETKALYLKLWQEMIRRNRNHPSIVAWCMGNELYDSFEQAPAMYRLAKELDPTRPVIDSDGVARKPRETLDYAVWQFSESASCGYQDAKYRFEPGSLPVVAHEMGYFVTLPDLRQLELFREGLKPYWLYEVRDKARSTGAESAYLRWVDCSNRLQAACLKTNIEAARRSSLQGYHVWLFQDYPWCAEGVVDMFYRPKAVTAERFRAFNAPTVLLPAQDRRNYRCGEKVEFPLSVSRYEQPATAGATLHWELRSGEERLATGAQTGLAIPCGEVRHLTTISFEVPRLPRAEQLRLTVQLDDTQGPAANEWKIWCFPAERRVTGKFAVAGSNWLQLRYPQSADKEQAQLLVTDRWEPAVLDRLAAGGRVLMLDPEPVFPAAKTRYRPSGWDPSDPAGHVGTIFDSQHPALRAMPAEGWCDLQFYDLIQGGKAVLLEKTPVTGEPILRMIDVPQRLARKAYLFEMKVGPGKLLVSGLNFSAAVPADDPAAAYCLDELVRYTLSDEFLPGANVAPEELRALLDSKVR
ncbi:MAG: hypothetical protein MUC88_18655 [Planctomycetes bacterium]|nr:hypothetical protein [Planctomycetota bacterium]